MSLAASWKTASTGLGAGANDFATYIADGEHDYFDLLERHNFNVAGLADDVGIQRTNAAQGSGYGQDGSEDEKEKRSKKNTHHAYLLNVLNQIDQDIARIDQKLTKLYEQIEHSFDRINENQEFIDDAQELLDDARNGDLDIDEATQLLKERGVEVPESASEADVIRLLQFNVEETQRENIDLGEKIEEDQRRVQELEGLKAQRVADRQEVKDIMEEYGDDVEGAVYAIKEKGLDTTAVRDFEQNAQSEQEAKQAEEVHDGVEIAQRVDIGESQMVNNFTL